MIKKNRRLNRYWTKNEKQVMKKLGLRPVPGSGSGEIHKEDGENDYILCQLKSTEAQSISISLLDIEKLLYHSELDNKIPVFAIQFLNGPLLLATVPEELGHISKYLNEDIFERKSIEQINIPKQGKIEKVRSSGMPLEDVIEMAKVNICQEEEEAPEDDYISLAIRKRDQRKINEKERRKWQR